MGGRVVFALIAAAVLLEAAPCEGRDVVVLRAHLQFSAAPVAKAPRVIFSLPERDERYSLWLEPEFDVTRHLSSLELVLQKAGSDTAATNMLDPPGHWHGYQKYMFAASDFARGPEQSAYGRTRTMSVNALELMLRIDVIQAPISALSGSPGGSENQFEKLDLAIEMLRTTEGP